VNLQTSRSPHPLRKAKFWRRELTFLLLELDVSGSRRVSEGFDMFS
jgi:hypothetical protein